MQPAQKTLLITGSNRGLGHALVKEALARGASRVYAAARVPADFGDARVTPLALELTDAESVAKAVRTIPSLDVLVNNAGVGEFDALEDPRSLERHFAVNVFGMLRVTHAVSPLLRASRGAVLTNLSLASLAPVPAMGGYSVSKAAAWSVTQLLRMQLARDGVRVHAAFLGPLDTEMSKPLAIPKTSPELAARQLFDGLARGEADLFPDDAAAPLAAGWNAGVVKALEAQFAGFLEAR